MYVCVRACVHVCLRVCVPVSLRVCMRREREREMTLVSSSVLIFLSLCADVCFSRAAATAEERTLARLTLMVGWWSTDVTVRSNHSESKESLQFT